MPTDKATSQIGRWEYRITFVPMSHEDAVLVPGPRMPHEEDLNRQGAEGWELVGLMRGRHRVPEGDMRNQIGISLVFKRRLAE